MFVQAYLDFDGRCEEALEFYRQALGAEVTALMRVKESPDPVPAEIIPPEAANKIMHSVLKIGETTVMATDGYCKGAPSFQGVTLSLQVSTAAEAEKLFTALTDGGNVVMPLGKTFWSPCFGMVKDRFGVMWMVNLVA